MKAEDVLYISSGEQAPTWVDKQGRWYHQGVHKETFVVPPRSVINGHDGEWWLLHVDGELRFGTRRNEEWYGCFPEVVGIEPFDSRIATCYTADNHSFRVRACGDGMLRRVSE